LLATQSPDEACAVLVARGDWLWAMDELMDAWRAAESGARRAYEAWLRSGAAKAYVVYRAEQDRADAAQDALGLHKEAESIAAQIYGNDTPAYARVIANLAIAHHQLGEDARAQQLGRRAYELAPWMFPE
jgi:hypothetical protein